MPVIAPQPPPGGEAETPTAELGGREAGSRAALSPGARRRVGGGGEPGARRDSERRFRPCLAWDPWVLGSVGSRVARGTEEKEESCQLLHCGPGARLPWSAGSS